MKIEYIVVEHSEQYPQDAASFETGHEEDWLDDIASDAGEHEWTTRDGWERTWPLTFELFIHGKSVGKFKVGMEAVPHFYAEKAT